MLYRYGQIALKNWNRNALSNSQNFNLSNWPILDDKVPSRWFWDKTKCVNSLTSYSSMGIDPSNSLLLTLKFVSILQFPTLLGIVPCKLFISNWIWIIFSSWPIAEGMVPERWLFLRFKTLRLLRLVISEGIVPNK